MLDGVWYACGRLRWQPRRAAGTTPSSSQWGRMDFEIVGEITDVEPIAIGTRIRIFPLLRKRYGRGRWRKLKGVATVRLFDGTVRRAEVHWFEAHGIGQRKMRIKRFLD